MPGAVARARAIARAVEESGEPWVATTLVSGQALVLGALQRERQVRQRHADLRMYRAETRSTTGVSLLVSEGAVQQLIVVPRVNGLFGDASAGNFINRTVRGFLRAYNGCGAKAHYFGREHFTLSRRPAGVLGLDVTSGGVWILEAWVGLEAATALDEFNGHSPIGLREALRQARSKRAEDSAGVLVERLHERLRGAFEVPAEAAPSEEPERIEDDPSGPEGIQDSDVHFAQREVPIGVLELGCKVAEPSGSFDVRCRGDVLTSVAAVRDLERRLQGGARAEALEALAGVPWEGARPGDLEALIEGLPLIS